MMRDWIHSHPHRSDPEVRPAAIDWLNSSIAELDKPDRPLINENDRPARRPKLRAHLKRLVMAILPQAARPEKGVIR